MWKSVQVNKQNIKAETGNAYLIAMPHNSGYDGYSFWHTAKLVREGRHSNAVSVSYTDDFNFTLKKYGKGKYNSREVISELTIGSIEFEEAFGVMSDNIRAPKVKNDYETRKPADIEAVKTEADNSLVDDNELPF